MGSTYEFDQLLIKSENIGFHHIQTESPQTVEFKQFANKNIRPSKEKQKNMINRFRTID